jgi:6 kDa early secretory antigenic target
VSPQGPAAAVTAAAADCETIARQINNQLDDLKTYLNPLVGTWTGETANHYRGLEADWDRSARDLTAVLRQIRKVLESAGPTMGRTDEPGSR